MILDLVMWGKNGAKTLRQVLGRIDEVIPQEIVNNKIFIDDHSSDETVKITKSFNWKVYENPSWGISAGANEALRHVESPFFISVEQDLLLARNWFDVIPKYMDDPKVVVAQGIRKFTNKVLRILEEYSIQSRLLSKAYYSIDNNIFRTRLFREIEGFPAQDKIGVDVALFNIVKKSRYKWVVDEDVISDHIRDSIIQHVRHRYRTVMLSKTVRRKARQTGLIKYVRLFSTSPLRAFQLTLTKRCPHVFFMYPILRLAMLKEYVYSKKMETADEIKLS